MLVLVVLCFFFVKQKTAYEMRISDWSSDVRSSDLVQGLNRCKVREISGRSPSLPGRDRLLCGRKRFPEYYEPRPVGWKPDGKCDMSVLLLPGSRRPDLSTHGIPKFRKTTHNPVSSQSKSGLLVTASEKIVIGIAGPVKHVTKANQADRK